MKPKKIKNCEGGPTDTCIVKKETLDQFEMEVCQVCYKVVSSVNINKQATAKKGKSKKSAESRINSPKVKKEKKQEHKFNYHWYLSDGYSLKNDYTEFGSFSCGGGTTMGFKIAGFNSLGGIEIDPKVANVYKKNHNPEYFFVEGVKEFAERLSANVKQFKKDYPKLFDLDIFSGSPPCSSFSMSGDRADAWGKQKVFREGQTLQVLDTLFFDFIKVAKVLQPKIVIAENVTGLLAGEARSYVRKIYEDLEDAGYYTKHYILDASEMGVPQARKRVFFISLRSDLATNCFDGAGVELFSSYPPIELRFKEPLITFKKATQEFWKEDRKPLTETAAQYYDKTEQGNSFSKEHAKGSLFNWMKLAEHKPAPTLACENRDVYFHPTIPGVLNDKEYLTLGSFPLDFDSLDMDAKWFVGMSVPPVMMAQIADRVKTYWLDVIYKSEYFNKDLINRK